MEAFKKIEKEHQEKFKGIKLDCFEPCYVIKVTIVCFDQVSDSFLKDKFDTPDPYFEVECASSGRKYVTSPKRNQTSGSVNETFQFVISQPEQPYPIIVRLYDSDVITRDDCLGEVTLEAREIPLNENCEKCLDFGGHGRARAKLFKTLKESPDFRAGFELCPGEMKFREKRLPLVAGAVRELIGEERGPRTPQEAPIISVSGSGGGYRALMGNVGAFEALNEMGVTDAVTYIEVISGSAWYLSSVYAQRLVGLENQDKLHDFFKEAVSSDLVELLLSPSFYRKVSDFIDGVKDRFGQPSSFIDYFGYALGNALLADLNADAKITDMQDYVKDGRVPFPIFLSIVVKDTVIADEFSIFIEKTPFEAGFPQLGISVNPEDLGSIWDAGTLARKCPQFSLHFLLGCCGCAFAMLLIPLLDRQNEYSTELHNYLESLGGPNIATEDEESGLANLISALPDSVEEYLKQTDLFLSRTSLIGRTGLMFNIIYNLKRLNLVPFNPLPSVASSPGRQEKEILKRFGKIQARKLELQKETFEVVDAALKDNVSGKSVLRPQRQSDLLIVFDYSDYGSDDHFSYNGLFKAAVDCWIEGLNFPDFDFKGLVNSPAKELVVFEPTSDDCPAVMWFTLSNTKFRQLDNYKPRRPQTSFSAGEKFNDFPVFGEGSPYQTNNVHYDGKDFERISELMRYNVMSHSQDILDQIGKATERRRRRIESTRKV